MGAHRGRLAQASGFGTDQPYDGGRAMRLFVIVPVVLRALLSMGRVRYVLGTLTLLIAVVASSQEAPKPRLPLVDPFTQDAVLRPIFDGMRSRGLEPLNIHRTIGHAPELYKALRASTSSPTTDASGSHVGLLRRRSIASPPGAGHPSSTNGSAPFSDMRRKWCRWPMWTTRHSPRCNASFRPKRSSSSR